LADGKWFVVPFCEALVRDVPGHADAAEIGNLRMPASDREHPVGALGWADKIMATQRPPKKEELLRLIPDAAVVI